VQGVKSNIIWHAARFFYKLAAKLPRLLFTKERKKKAELNSARSLNLELAADLDEYSINGL